MKLLMYVCLNSLLGFAMCGVIETIQSVIDRFSMRYRGALAFLFALAIMYCLLFGLLLGAFHE